MFEDIDRSRVPQHVQDMIPPLPEALVIDMALVVGMDVSFVEILPVVIGIVQQHNCKLVLSGVSETHR